MNMFQTRDMVTNAYPFWAWKNRVASMSDQQVTAVYLNLKQRGVFDKKPKPVGPKRYHSIYNALEAAEKKRVVPVVSFDYDMEQLSLF